MVDSDLHEEGTFKIGAVARLTGLSTHTLRKWESRYDAVVPVRTERGQRVYSEADVERLRLIRRLVDAGVAPRDVAGLSVEELTKKTAHLTPAETVAGAETMRALRVALVGRAIEQILEGHTGANESLDIVARAATASGLDDLQAAQQIDVLVFECDSVGAGTRRTLDALVQRIDARAAVVVYRFGSRGDLLSLQSPRYTTLRAPTDFRTFEKVAMDLVHPHRGSAALEGVSVHKVDNPADVPAPRLSREVISEIARSAPKMQCECPHHLAEILTGLLAFEEYSALCESRNPQDAALHNYLWRSAAQARALFEDAIEVVAEAEGISIEG